MTQINQSLFVFGNKKIMKNVIDQKLSKQLLKTVRRYMPFLNILVFKIINSKNINKISNKSFWQK